MGSAAGAPSLKIAIELALLEILRLNPQVLQARMMATCSYASAAMRILLMVTIGAVGLDLLKVLCRAGGRA